MIYSHSGLFECKGALSGKGANGQQFSIVDVTAKPVQNMGAQVLPPDMDMGFRGIIVSFPHKSRFLSRTIIREDRGVANPKVVDAMKRVGFVSSEFEKIFEVYSDDQVESRALITPDFMERLIALSGKVLGHRVQVCFLGGQIHIALNIDDNFRFSNDVVISDLESAKKVVLAEAGSVCVLLEDLDILQSYAGGKRAETADKTRKDHYLENLQTMEAYLSREEVGENWGSGVEADMANTYYMFCDSIRGMLKPRF